jgi:hypothetical protein
MRFRGRILSHFGRWGMRRFCFSPGNEIGKSFFENNVVRACGVARRTPKRNPPL